MIPQTIVFHSAGSLAVAVLALIMALMQLLLLQRQPRLRWCAWGAAISISGMLYALGIFLEYNLPAGVFNRRAGLLEFTAIILMIHCVYGFSCAYLEPAPKSCHIPAAIFHALVLLVLWSTNAIVADRFIHRDLIGLPIPFTEAEVGPLGPTFMVYGFLASLFLIRLWVRQPPPDAAHRKVFITGMVFWLLLAGHDGAVIAGLCHTPYLMEYGFMAFCVAVLWVVFNGYAEIATIDEYRTITELIHDGILMMQDGRAVFANPACERLMGRAVKNRPISDLLDALGSGDRENLQRYYDDILAGQAPPAPQTIETIGDHQPKRVVEIQAKRVLFRQRPAILAVVRDITQRIREEAALKANEEKITRLKKMESLGLLAGGVAHDLNNVLSGIVSYPELMLLDLPEGSRLRKPIETIHESGQRAVAIVQDLLTVARGVATAKEVLNLNEVITAYLSSPEFDKLMQFHPWVAIRHQLDPNLLNIRGSVFHVRKTVMNLVSNAAEAICKQGEVRISTFNCYVDRPLKGYDEIQPGEYAVLRVEDSGPGISAEDLQRIFEPFFTKKVMGRSGTGLGLALVWNVIQDQQGHIDVTSTDAGSRFDLYFPITRDARECSKNEIPIENLRGSGQAILIIDDVAAQREISGRMLETLGYRTQAVSSGEAAVAYMQNHKADLLLLDMIMDPGIDGRETFRRIKALYPEQKAVIVSGFAQTDQVTETLAMGAGRFLKKPLILEELGAAVKAVLEAE